MDNKALLQQLPRETLEAMLADFAKNWLAHDGLWFLAAEAKFDMAVAMELDTAAWEKFTVIEAKRLMRRHHIAPGGGVPALAKALQLRMYAFLNDYRLEVVDNHTLRFFNITCRVQHARQRDGRPLFPCKSVGIAEYTNFAKTIDPRFTTHVIACPPDDTERDFMCGWEFTLIEKN